MIEINNVSKNFSTLVVFEDFSLSIKKGTFTCILGESGSGKTTLLNMLANLTEFNGKISQVDCSYVFQRPTLFPNMTVKDNLLMVCSDLQKVEKIVSDFNLVEKLNSYPKHLSGGQAQRVSLARGMIYEKEVLLLDEPFSDLDIGLKYKLMKYLKNFQQNKKNTVIMVTHDIKEAVSLADRILILSNGKVVYDVSDIDDSTEKKLINLFIERH